MESPEDDLSIEVPLYFHCMKFIRPSHKFCTMFSLQFVSPTISISVLTVISIDRFLSLTRPVLSKAPRICILRPSWLIAFAWCYSTIQFLPTFHFSTLLPVTISNTTVFYCTPIPNKSLPGRLYLVVLFLASFVLPVTTMSVLYCRVARVVWNRSKQLLLTSQNDNNSKIMDSSRKTVTRMLLTVVAVFFVCWMPFVVYSGFLENQLKGFPNPMDAVRLGLYGLGLFNSICNPFIYYFNGVNLNPRVLIENERKRRNSSVSSSYHATRMNSLKSTRLSSGNCSDSREERHPSLEPKRTLSNSTCPSMSPNDEDHVFVFTTKEKRSSTVTRL